MSTKKKVLIIFGTRPEAIKMAPLVQEFQTEAESFETRVCVTAQHREMLDQVMDFFDLTADYDLDIMQPGQDLNGLTARIITGMKPVLDDFEPDYVFVHGDTTTTMAASIASFYAGARVCHIEAGLRTHNIRSPFPEEVNRQVTGRIADFHFSPTEVSKLNLINENVDEAKVLVTGNTVIDALLESVKRVKNRESSFIKHIQTVIDDQPLVLITGHRRENHGAGFERICRAIRKLALSKPDHKFVYPVHLNPKVQEPVNRLLSDIDNVVLIAPLSYPDFIWMMDRSTLIITDSGGVQEEAPSLGKPVLVLRDTTERPEAVDAGTVVLVGTDGDKIYQEAISLLEDENRYKEMSTIHNPYGDGKASRRVVDFILQRQ
ncbi:MAG: UDP-N-acetylglucosamine 2-epimerase (non-hydrolyzing) [Nonlabens sp.]